MPDLGSSEAIFTVIVAIAGFALGTWLRLGPGKQVSAMADALLGEQEVKDRSGKVVREARPGLVHLQREDSARLSKVEEAVVEFRHVIGIYTEVIGRLTQVEADVAILKDDRVKDIVTAAERAATAAVSTEMLRLADRAGVIDAESDEQ